MKISLITTVKNESEYAATLIDSILGQTRVPDEWIVVDGGSIDDTAEKFRAIPLCTVIECDCNRARGRNIAIRKASGNTIAVTDAGCIPDINWLKELADGVKLQHRQIAAGRTICRINKPFDAAQHVLMDQFVNNIINIRQPTASCRSLAFCRETWQEYNFPEWLNISEDSFLLTKWRENGWTIKFVNKANVEWIPPQFFGSFVKQYFTYMRGESIAVIHTKRHILRLVFYLVVILLPLISGNTYTLFFSLLTWFIYFLFTSMRLTDVLSTRSLNFRVKTVLWLFPALLTMDAAKIAGFLTGQFRRLLVPFMRKRN